MRRRVLLYASVVLSGALCLASCRTASTKLQLTEKPAKRSLAEQHYLNTMEDQLGPIWYRLVETHQKELGIGTVKTTFEIPAAGGSVHNVRVKSSTGNRMDELIARRAIDQLRAPPVPPALLAELHQNHVNAEESFTIFPQR